MTQQQGGEAPAYVRLVDFLRARIAEDAALASGPEARKIGSVPPPATERSGRRLALVSKPTPPRSTPDVPTVPLAVERLRLEVEVKQEILDTFLAWRDEQEQGPPDDFAAGLAAGAEWVLRALALVYREHPDYWPGWAI